MKNIIISILFAFGLLTNLVANDLTQENVKSFLLDSDRLVLSKNVDKLGELLDENVDIVGTQRIWPARAFILGHLTHNDLASVRIAKRATKSL